MNAAGEGMVLNLDPGFRQGDGVVCSFIPEWVEFGGPEICRREIIEVTGAGGCRIGRR
ncbi:MAG: hypothetical protein AAGG50_01160 [Bacteroidota bacterium]